MLIKVLNSAFSNNINMIVTLSRRTWCWSAFISRIQELSVLIIDTDRSSSVKFALNEAAMNAFTVSFGGPQQWVELLHALRVLTDRGPLIVILITWYRAVDTFSIAQLLIISLI